MSLAFGNGNVGARSQQSAPGRCSLFSGSLLHCSTAAQFRRDTMLFPISFLSVWFPPLSASMHARGRVSCAPSSLVAVLCSALLSPRRWRAAPTTCDGSASSSSRVGSNRQVKQSKGEWSCPMGHGRSATVPGWLCLVRLVETPGASESICGLVWNATCDGWSRQPATGKERGGAGESPGLLARRCWFALVAAPRPGWPPERGEHTYSGLVGGGNQQTTAHAGVVRIPSPTPRRSLPDLSSRPAAEVDENERKRRRDLTKTPRQGSLRVGSGTWQQQQLHDSVQAFPRVRPSSSRPSWSSSLSSPSAALQMHTHGLGQFD